MGEPAHCMVLFTSARGVGYTTWVNARFVWQCFTCARCVGYTRWVNPRFVWYSLLTHVAWVTLEPALCALVFYLCTWRGLHWMGERVLCVVLCTSARDVGYTG